MKPSHLLWGSALAAAGGLAGIWLAPGFLGVLALVALMRICWLEDNIISDLFGRDHVPMGYRNTAQRRRNFLANWFGIWSEASIAESSAHLMATAMRTEVQIWGTLLLGMAATLVAQMGPFSIWLNAGLGLALFALTLLRVERLAISLSYCEAQVAMPDEMLLPRLRKILADRGR